MNDRQAEALRRVFTLACEHHSGARVAAHVLLSLYNGDRFKVDLTDLRRLDEQNLTDVLCVIELDARRCQQEIHWHLNDLYCVTDMGLRLEWLAYNWRLKGAAKKADLSPVAPLTTKASEVAA